MNPGYFAITFSLDEKPIATFGEDRKIIIRDIEKLQKCI